MNTLYFICGLSLGFSLCGWIVAAVMLWKIKHLRDQLQLANRMIDRLEGQIDEDEPSDLGLN
jgi:hypothetical protein